MWAHSDLFLGLTHHKWFMFITLECSEIHRRSNCHKRYFCMVHYWIPSTQHKALLSADTDICLLNVWMNLASSHSMPYEKIILGQYRVYKWIKIWNQISKDFIFKKMSNSCKILQLPLKCTFPPGVHLLYETKSSSCWLQ